MLSAAIAGLLAAGCGGQASKAVAPSAPASASQAAGSELTAVAVAIPVKSLSVAPLLLAQAEGIFARHHLAVHLVSVQGGTTSAQALASGSAQFDAGAASDVLLADQKGLSLVSIATFENQVSFELVARPSYLAAHGVTANTPLTDRLKALKGAKIGILGQGSADDVALRVMMASAGLHPVTDYHEIALGGPPGELAALEKGGVDAVIGNPTVAVTAVDQKFGQIVAEPSSFPTLKDQVFGDMITTAAYIQQHPQVVREMAASIAEADAFLVQHPKQATAIFAKIFPTTPASVIAQTLPLYGYSPDGRSSQQEWQNVVQSFNLSGFGHLSTQGLSKVYTNQFLPAASP